MMHYSHDGKGVDCNWRNRRGVFTTDTTLVTCKKCLKLIARRAAQATPAVVL